MTKFLQYLALALFFLVTINVCEGNARADENTPVAKDHWDNWEECIAAHDAPLYYPSLKSNRKLGPSYVERGHPTGGCVHMELPDRVTENGWGWVRIGTDRPMAYNWRTNTFDYLWWCVNKLDGFVPFPPIVGEKGDPGEQGEPGPPGLSCWDLNANGRTDPEEDINGDDVWDSLDCKGAPGPPAEPCTIIKTYGPLRKFVWQECPGKERVLLRAGLRPRTVVGLVILGVATGGVTAAATPALCTTVVGGAAVGGATSAAVAGVANVVADTDNKKTTNNESASAPNKEKP